MNVSVVIPAHNEEKHIGKCLDSLMNQEEKPYEIIVVNNSSTDDTAGVVKKYKGVILVSKKEPGIIPTRNEGFDMAKGVVIARCDADTMVPKDWIKNIALDFERDESIVAVSMPVLFSDIKWASKWLLLYYLYMFIPRIFMGHYPLVGPSMAVRKSAWEKIRKELCTDAKAVHEDIDVSFHIKKLGKVYHDGSTVALSSGRRMRYHPWSFFGEYAIRFFKMLRTH